MRQEINCVFVHVLVHWRGVLPVCVCCSRIRGTRCCTLTFINLCLSGVVSLICLVKVHQPTRTDVCFFQCICVARVKVLMWQLEEKWKQQTGCYCVCLAQAVSHPTSVLSCKTASVFSLLWAQLPVRSVQSRRPQGEHQTFPPLWPVAHAPLNLGSRCNSQPASPRVCASDLLLALYTCCIQLQSLFSASPWLSAQLQTTARSF